MPAARALRVLHSAFLILWVVVTTVLFTLFILLVRPFSLGLALGATRLWTLILLFMSGIRLDVRGLERLDRRRSYLFMANHASALDIPILYAALPYRCRIRFLAKRELFLIPFFGWALAATGHVPVDRKSPRKARRAVSRAVELLRRRRGSLAVFPEGTRSRTGELGVFKLGVFSIAVDSGASIVPVAVRNSHALLPPGSYLLNPSSVAVRIGDPVSTSGFTRKSKDALASVVRDHLEVLLSDRD